MRLSRLSIIPIELFTNARLDVVKKAFIDANYFCHCQESVVDIFKELSGEKSAFYKLSPAFGKSMYVAIHESSFCIYIKGEKQSFSPNMQTLQDELLQRNILHEKIITNSTCSPLYGILKEINANLKKSIYGKVKINYVFSFYVLQNAKQYTDSKIIKILAEPSMVDIDDMLSTKAVKKTLSSCDIKENYISSIQDVDISAHSITYITWATIVAQVDNDNSADTVSLLVALEARLQTVWNRCFAVSEFIDNVFDNAKKPSDIDELYWSFAKTLDDAKSVLSSTFSSRADKLFDEMVRTSKLEGEIDRLEQKLFLLDKYIDKQNQKISKKYQKTIELLLFITAIASLAQIFFPLPMSFLPNWAEYIVIGVLICIGIVAIYKSR